MTMNVIWNGFVFVGRPTVIKPKSASVIIPFKSEDDCVRAAKHWANVTDGHTACYCVQNGIVAGRAFASFWHEDIIYRR